MKKRSSETTREARNFNFTEYIKIKPTHINKVDRLFLEWFVGFSEGDGSFITTTNKKTNLKKLSFCINQKDSKLMYKIKKKLGFGSVSVFIQNNTTYYRYSVYNFQNITRLIHLFNGNLLLQKVNQKFLIWLNTYNTKYNTSIVNFQCILYKQCKITLSLESAWLSGFTDAEGGFYVSLTKQANLKLKYRLRIKFYITQKYEYSILKNIMTLILKLNNENNTIFSIEDRYISNFKLDFYRLEISTHQYILKLINYFDTYKLQGKKYIVFSRWKRIFQNKDILKKKASTSEKSLIRFKRLVHSV